MGPRRALSLSLVCAAISGCSLIGLSDLTGGSAGDAGDASNGDDATRPGDAGGAGDTGDTGKAAMTDAAAGDVGFIPDVSVPTCDGACGAPMGFAPILFALDPNTSCPPGTTTVNGPADPSIGGACACNCQIDQPPSCLPIVLTHDLGDTAGACSSVSSFTPTVDGGCDNGGSIGLHAYWSIPPPMVVAPGTCSGTPADDPSAVATVASRMCIDPTCQSTCSAPAGFKACVMASGEVPCPGGYATHHVGNVTVSCGTCSACGVGGSCGGTVALYSDTSCATKIGSVPVDGTCQPTGGPATLGSLVYTPAIVNGTCTPGSATGTVALQQELTVCCL
ncbi:MAG TPA: hypothetical protein VF765_29615 [Polyangiaceae bacterium]